MESQVNNPQQRHFVLKSVFSVIRVRTWVHVGSFPAKKTGFQWVDQIDQPIRGLFFWRETTWNHVLTRISGKTDFKRYWPVASGHLLSPKKYNIASNRANFIGEMDQKNGSRKKNSANQTTVVCDWPFTDAVTNQPFPKHVRRPRRQAIITSSL